MADEYRAQLIATEAKLAKDPENEDLLTLKDELIEMIELAGSMEEEEKEAESSEKYRGADDQMVGQKISRSRDTERNKYNSSLVSSSYSSDHSAGGRIDDDSDGRRPGDGSSSSTMTKRQFSEAELLAKKREKNRKKKEKLREKRKEQFDLAESVKQTWQSFAQKKGLKGVTKKSIFSSPHSVAGKVGVGTNGIADAPSVGATASTSYAHTKRKY